MVYYIEYVFLENFIIDFILLFITGKLIKRIIFFKRLIVASLIGALYVILAIYSGREFMTYFIVKFSISVLMIIVAFDSKGILMNIRVIICFYITSLIMAGIMTALYITYDKLTVNAIGMSIFAGYAGLHFFFKEIKGRISKHNYKRMVSICIGNKTKVIQAYIDTGNSLTDPVTNKPVMVVNIECLRDILGEDICARIMDFYQNNNYENLIKENENINLRVIKYNTISSKNENMVCIVPDKIEIINNNIKIDAIIGIHPKKISNEDYDALLFKKLLDWETEREYV